MQTLDVLGQPCPIPVIKAKKALAEPQTDGVLVLVDNRIAVQNLEKMAEGSGYGFSFNEESENRFLVTITRGDSKGASPEEKAKNDLRVNNAPGGLVILIGADHLGEGAEELGKMLLKGFVFSLTQLDPLPEAIIFLNGGARMTAEGAVTVPDLLALQGMGVTLLTCGTCANFYGITDKIVAGAITDMMDIVNRISRAGRLIAV
ncbi:MAG: sulfurtransferase-like selenium metabolism protein YedF [Synergistaceae bacterium]|nr:sulfurtransferase-like selenium metabolism protein YedF [Synergistaceae bacterium]